MFCLAAATGRLDMRGARGELVTAHGFREVSETWRTLVVRTEQEGRWDPTLLQGGTAQRTELVI